VKINPYDTDVNPPEAVKLIDDLKRTNHDITIANDTAFMGTEDPSNGPQRINHDRAIATTDTFPQLIALSAALTAIITA
jgi:hypothetical protein